MMLMICAGGFNSMFVVCIDGPFAVRGAVTLGLVMSMFTWPGMIFVLRGLGAGRPDKGDMATAAGAGLSVVDATAAAAAGVVDKQALDARHLRELHHGATQIKVYKCRYLD